MTSFEVYKGLEKRISELKPDVRERLLHFILGVIVDGRMMDAASLHLAILNLEKSVREDMHYVRS